MNDAPTARRLTGEGDEGPFSTPSPLTNVPTTSPTLDALPPRESWSKGCAGKVGGDVPGNGLGKFLGTGGTEMAGVDEIRVKPRQGQRPIEVEDRISFG